MNDKILLKDVLDHSIMEWFKMASNAELNKVKENLQVIKSNLPMIEKTFNLDSELMKTENQFLAANTIADVKYITNRPEVNLENMMLGDMNKLMENIVSNMFGAFFKNINSILKIRNVLDEKIGLTEAIDQIDKTDIEYLFFVELKNIEDKLGALIHANKEDYDNIFADFDEMVKSKDLKLINQKNEIIQRYYLKLKPNHVMENIMMGGTDELQTELVSFQNVIGVVGEIELFIKLFKIIEQKI
ncbi:hypothetical protein [Williamsoniiplasma lucivorax]|uniref:Uncharacterized protein n=1 Tax=Williamsoniiplasma lucivorax TaxID=209274 RepID=A0A2S5RCW0_9MOLU|nr:hypothetical protein [Williamsoniiplasma lucivorax]PPE05171.1 hypothetical protein ELUCI_v1c07070 [Williamsoniiplasma lucivorax]